jgi:tetratricopeptide (TPR) repeat protein
MKRMATLLSIAFLSLAAGAQTNDPQALVQRGRDAVKHGEPEKAVELFEKAVVLKPNNADFHYRLASAQLQAGMRAGMFGGMSMLPRAKAMLERAIQLDPNLIAARFALMEVYVSARHGRRERVGRFGAGHRDPKARHHRRPSRVRAHSHRCDEA